jgi:predicted nucleic acid-binding protein
VIVADANLVVYLRVTGAYSPRAEAVLRRDAEWAAPLLCRSEVRNVLARMVRAGLLTLDDALAAMEEIDAVIGSREYAVRSPDVLRLARASRCTAYDCEYVALAEALGAPFVTSDRQVLRAFPRRAVSPEEFIGEA